MAADLKQPLQLTAAENERVRSCKVHLEVARELCANAFQMMSEVRGFGTEWAEIDLLRHHAEETLKKVGSRSAMIAMLSSTGKEHR